MQAKTKSCFFKSHKLYKIMKLKLFKQFMFASKQMFYIFLLQLFTLQLVNANQIRSQSIEQVKISVELKKAGLEKIFSDIEEKTDFVFIYDSNILKTNQTSSLDFKNEPVIEVLKKVANKFNLNFRQINNTIFVKENKQTEVTPDNGSNQQPVRRISGKVTDNNGLALPGASVFVKGTTTGTVTGADGTYHLNIGPGDNILVFSFIGMKIQEIKITGKQEINVSLADETIGLEEVVAIGYGTMKKSDLTGAIAQIDPTAMEEKLTSNATDLLRNNMAGLYIPFSTNPKGSVEMDDVLIRGTTSLKASNTPLIVLDGMIYDGDLANISSADIERVDVLKDASSAAIYGSRAANGVIIITTKQGTTGAPAINLSVNTGLVTTSSLRSVYSAEDYTGMRTVYSETNSPRDGQPYYYNDPNNLPSGISLADWLAYDGASSNATDVWLARIGFFPAEIDNYKAGKTIDWEDVVFQTGIRQDYLMSITGGTDQIKYYWSTNYTNNEGFVVGEEYESFRSRLNLESKISSFLTVGLNVQFANRDESSIPAGWEAYVWGSPYGSLYEDDGKTLKYLTYDYNLSENPLYTMTYTDRHRKNLDLNSKLYAILDLPFGFSYQVNVINNYSSYRSYDHESSESEANSNGGEASRTNRTIYSWTIDNILKWTKTFGVHDLDLTLLANAEKQKYWSDEMVNSQFFPSDILGYHGMDVGQDPRVSSDDQTYTRDALLGRLNYTLSSKYYLTLALRRDGYSAFGQANPHAYFPTAALAWKISEENFFHVKPVDFLKIRVSWGTNGNSDIGAYSALATMESKKYLYSDENGVVYSTSELQLARMANASLKWEKTKAVNTGIDFGLFKSRLNGSVEGYFSRTTGLLTDRKLPSVTGYESVAANLGKIENKGFEFTLNSTNLDINGKLLWKSSFNCSLNKNKIVHLYGDMADVLDEEGNVTGQEEADDYENGWFIGESTDVVWDYDSDGIWQEEEAEEASSHGGYYPGQFKNVDVNEDGTYTASDDKQFLGHSRPQFRWNLTNNFTIFQNISFSFSLYGHHGHIRNFSDSAGSSNFGTGNGYDMPYWTPENRSNKYPGMRGAGGTNYRSSSFVRLNDITVGYTFPERVTRYLHLNKLKVYGSVNNVHVWTNWPGWDPENPDGPSPRYFNLGVNVGL